ncbi:hypothetical protein A6V39_05075 [Candidatus Mycoplasma haematobovis]|uniref:Uncharacterized protein n=1 Tax=Candidatus Mycoplasma haematobovis TaxID=432608 RepID=A0A1A9QDM7_9MOLU|nr:hypothetical protein [Candidatus Mycoplasma haematobovis]OAL09800.1 hypothetical protein A6V39_05075 [Candidatus Mycoplasma haematobovis]
MTISPSLITNISLGSIGLATVGGVVYGSYELLKHDPREVKEFLQVKKRALLSTNGNDDEQAWKDNWSKYIINNTPKPATPSEVGDSAISQPSSAPKETKKDVWDLEGWEKHKSKSDTVPTIFKTTCEQKSKEKVNGIWADTFKQVVDYCTKEIDGD